MTIEKGRAMMGQREWVFKIAVKWGLLLQLPDHDANVLDAMEEAVAAERERCEKIVGQFKELADGTIDGQRLTLQAQLIEFKIREGK